MTRSIHRRSLATRVLCGYVVLVVLVSFAGVGYAVPGSAGSAGLASAEETAVAPPETEVTPPPAEEGDEVAPDDSAEEPVPAEPVGEQGAEVTLPKTGPADSELLAVEPAGDAAAPLTNPTVPTAAGIVPEYVAGNPACTLYTEFKINNVPQNMTYTTGLPPGASITITNASAAGFDFSASGILVHKVIVKAADGAYIYDYDPSGIHADQDLYTVQKVGGGYFSISHVSFCYEVTPSTGHIIARKYHDVDGDDDRDGGEDWLGGFTFLLERGTSAAGPWTYVDRKTTESVNGQADFGNQVAGWYRLTEELSAAQIAAGWACTGANPRVFYHTGEVNGSDADEEIKWFGNRIVTHNKTFKLTIEGDTPPNTTFHAQFTVDGVPQDVALTGSNPFQSQTLELHHGAVIGDVSWYATWDPGAGDDVEILLGTTDGEVLTRDCINGFTYGGLLDGHKYEDLDADGVKDAGEPGLAGWTIVLERDVDGQWVPYDTEVTDANGYYKFCSVLPGTYRVSEDIASMVDYDWTQSKPVGGYYQLTFSPIMTASASVACVGTQHRNKDFMNWAPASIEGMKFEDLDGDGVKDAGDPGLESWVIYVDYDGDNIHDPGEPWDATDSDGHYLITGVTPGTYSVREVLPGDWFQSLGTYVVTFESRGHYGGEGEYDFGNWTYASKSGVKFHDLDADGVRDPNEPGLEGWTIYVDYDGDGIHDAGEPSDVTDATGHYSISGIQLGLYRVYEVQQAGWTQSYPASGYWEVDFTSGLDDTGNDFGNWTPASIEGMKFEDRDGDGTKDAGDTGLEGWIIFVDYDGDGVLDPNEPSDTTDADGAYEIDGVVPGTYWVREVLATDWTQSRGDFQVEFVSEGHYGEEGEYDFGNWTTTSLDGYKFLDKDADSVWDVSEPGLEGWTIYLIGTSVEGPVMLSTNTDATGYYSFDDLPPGTYTVSEELPTGWYQSYPATGIWDVTVYSGEAQQTSLDFGNWEPLDPWGYKFHDLDADGTWDANEPGLEGWEIRLDGTAGTGAEIHLVTYTDATGYWQFDEVPPGSYIISEVTSGWTQSYPAAPGHYEVVFGSQDSQEVGFDFGNWTTGKKYGMKFEDLDADGVKDAGEPALSGWTIFVDYDDDGVLDADEPFGVTDVAGYYEISGINPGTWAVREVMKVDYAWVQSLPGAPEFAYLEEFSSASEFRNNDFGNWAPASITGVKFEDLDADGVFDDDEPTLQGWRIYVDYDGDGMYDVGEPTDLTDEDGVYEITGITPGTYAVKEVLETDWHQTRGDFQVTFESRGAYGLEGEYDFGNWFAAEKAGTKFEDLDADGMWDQGEPGMAGWTIYVDYDGDGVHDAGEPSDVTDINGEYLITGITPGTYMVREVMKVDFDWVQSLPGAPTFAYEETFNSRDSFVANDFGNWAPASITGVKFEDLSGDGDLDPSDPGLSGWTIFVDYDGDGELDLNEPSDTTDADGVYEIDGVTPGTYMVREVMQADWTQSRGDFEVTFESRGVYGLEGEYDFGNWTTANLRGTKFHDLDGDGEWADGEPGLEGWEIHIVGTSGPAQGHEATTTTDADGNYHFDGLPPGDYEIAEVLVEGWTQSYPAEGTHDVTLESGEEPEASFDFGNWTTTGLSGHKFHDLDADGIWDKPDEEALLGWLVELTGTTGAGDPYYDAAITDVMGYYEFTNLPPGDYTVSEVQKPFWTQTAPEGDVFNETLTSGAEPLEDLDFGNSEDAEKFFELTYTGPVPADTTMTVTFDAYGPIYEDVGIALDQFGPQTVVLEPQGDGTFTGSFDLVPGTVIMNVEWWAMWRGEAIKLGDGIAEETINGPVTNRFEYNARVFGSKWDDTDLVDPETTLGQGDGIWSTGEPPLPDWTIELYRMGNEGWELWDTQLTNLDGAYAFEGLLPGQYYVAEVIPLDPVTGLPAWNQSAGPSGAGDESIVVEDGASVGPIDFGNWTPFAPFTVDIGIEKVVNPTQAKVGDTLTYTLKYTMVVGGIVDEPLTIVDDYDEDYVEIVDANGGVVSGGTITWTFNETLANGESDTLTYTARVKTGVADGTRIDNVVVIEMAGDSDPTNNRDDARVIVGEPFLPFTGGQLIPLLAIAAIATIGGIALRRTRRRSLQ